MELGDVHYTSTPRVVPCNGYLSVGVDGRTVAWSARSIRWVWRIGNCVSPRLATGPRALRGGIYGRDPTRTYFSKEARSNPVRSGKNGFGSGQKEFLFRTIECAD